MDIQSRKIEFVKNFLDIHNEKIISKLERTLKKEIEANPDFKPMSTSELKKGINKSIKDADEGRLISQSALELEIEKWD